MLLQVRQFPAARSVPWRRWVRLGPSRPLLQWVLLVPTPARRRAPTPGTLPRIALKPLTRSSAGPPQTRTQVCTSIHSHTTAAQHLIAACRRELNLLAWLGFSGDGNPPPAKRNYCAGLVPAGGIRTIVYANFSQTKTLEMRFFGSGIVPKTLQRPVVLWLRELAFTSTPGRPKLSQPLHALRNVFVWSTTTARPEPIRKSR